MERLENLGAEARKEFFGEKWYLKICKKGLKWKLFGVKWKEKIPKISFSRGLLIFTS